MVKEKKISIKYYLNKRMKPVEHGGKVYFILYGRVVFDRKSNNIPILDMLGDNVYVTEKDFKFYFELPSIPYWGGAKVVVCKEEILRQSLSMEYAKLGDRFILKDFLIKFRYYEKYLYQEYDRAITVKFLKLLEKHTTPVEYTDLSQVKFFPFLYARAKELFRPKYKMLKKEEKTENEKGDFTDDDFINMVDSDFVIFIEILVALERFTNYIGQIHDKESAQRIKGTFFAWLKKNGKEDYTDYLYKNFNNMKALSGVGHPIDILRQSFIPKYKDAKKHIQIIDNELFA